MLDPDWGPSLINSKEELYRRFHKVYCESRCRCKGLMCMPASLAMPLSKCCCYSTIVQHRRLPCHESGPQSPATERAAHLMVRMQNVDTFSYCKAIQHSLIAA